MSSFFIKILRNQEMGSPKIVGGKLKFYRGRYMLIQKEFIDFFPHLSSIVLNDSTALPIKPFYTDSIVYAQYVYHNSKLIPEEQQIGVSDRNEYRIYLNDQLDLGKQYFMPNDIVVFKKSRIDDQVYYPMDIYAPVDEHYSYLFELLNEHTSIVYEGDIPFFRESSLSSQAVIKEKKVIEAIESQQAQILRSENEQNNTNSLEASMGADLFNSRSFRDFVMNAYMNKCAITRTSIHCYNLLNLEAAHIKPQAHSGTFLPCNGIAMSRDMHFAFDKGFFTIMPGYIIKVHPDVLTTDSYLNQYDNKQMFVPEVDFFRPNETFLDHHRTYIYGSFKQIRQMDSF